MSAIIRLPPLGFGVEYFPGYVNRRRRLHSLNVVLLSFILRGHGRHYIEQDVSRNTAARSPSPTTVSVTTSSPTPAWMS